MSVKIYKEFCVLRCTGKGIIQVELGDSLNRYILYRGVPAIHQTGITAANFRAK